MDVNWSDTEKLVDVRIDAINTALALANDPLANDHSIESKSKLWEVSIRASSLPRSRPYKMQINELGLWVECSSKFMTGLIYERVKSLTTRGITDPTLLDLRHENTESPTTYLKRNISVYSYILGAAQIEWDEESVFEAKILVNGATLKQLIIMENALEQYSTFVDCRGWERIVP